MAAGGVTGVFTTTMLPALPGDLVWNIVYGTNSVDLTVEAPVLMLPGDFDGNGIVDMADYVVWRAGLGTTFTQDDYDVWRRILARQSRADRAWPIRPAIPGAASETLAFWCILIVCSIRYRKTGWLIAKQMS